MQIIILLLACIGACVIVRWLTRRRDRGQIWPLQAGDELVLLRLNSAWQQQPSLSASSFEFRHQRNGATMVVIIGPQMDPNTAVRMLLLQQKLYGLKVDESSPIAGFNGIGGRGCLHRSAFGDHVTACVVFATASNVVNFLATSRISGGEMTEDTVRAAKQVRVLSRR